MIKVDHLPSVSTYLVVEEESRRRMFTATYLLFYGGVENDREQSVHHGRQCFGRDATVVSHSLEANCQEQEE